MLILAVVAVVLAAPLAIRAARALFALHVRAVVLFLPAGLLLRLGPGRDLRVFFAVTAVWAVALWFLSRRPTDTSPRPRGAAS